MARTNVEIDKKSQGLHNSHYPQSGETTGLKTHNYEYPHSIDSGGFESLKLTPPKDEIWLLHDLTIRMKAPSNTDGATTGVYNIELKHFAYDDPLSGSFGGEAYIWGIKGSSNYNSAINFQRRSWTSADNYSYMTGGDGDPFPIWLGYHAPLEFLMFNDTDVQYNQNGDAIRIVPMYEVIEI